MPRLSERTKGLLATSAPLVLLFAYLLGVDVLFGWTSFPGVVAVTLFWGVFFGLPVALAVPSDLAFAPLAVYALLCCVLPSVPVSPVKSFRMLHHDIQRGETVADALEARGRRFPDGGLWKAPVVEHPGADQIVLRLDPDDGRYDAEIILLEVEDGRVLAVTYHAD